MGEFTNSQLVDRISNNEESDSDPHRALLHQSSTPPLLGAYSWHLGGCCRGSWGGGLSLCPGQGCKQGGGGPWWKAGTGRQLLPLLRHRRLLLGTFEMISHQFCHLLEIQ